MQWTPKYGNKLKELLVSETGNGYQCMDYSVDGEVFAVAGKTPVIEIYSEHGHKSLIKKICELTCPFIKNRIFCLKFDPINPNGLWSGGWDSTVQGWDLRTGKVTSTIYGPQICGQAIDIHPDKQMLLTGSHLG